MKPYIFYEWLISEFKECTSYTKEHLEILAKALKITFGDNWSLTTDKIGKILNQIYNIDCINTRFGTVSNYIFYKNIMPKTVPNKKLRIYTIKSRIEIQDIKKELALTSSDLSLEYSIQRQKSKMLNQLDSNIKEILLEGLF